MAERNKRTPSSQAIATKKNSEQKLSINKVHIIPAFLVLLYLSICFIPDFDAADVMTPQWLLLVIINLITTGYIALKKNNTDKDGVKKISTSVLSLMYLGVFILAGSSIFQAINKIESLVGYARFIATIVSFFNFAILLYYHRELLKFSFAAIAIILLLKSLAVIYGFFNGLGELDLDKLINSLKGNTGNKNIMAASLTIMLPFVVYGIHTYKTVGKIFHTLILLIAITAIFILNARAAYLGVIVQMLVYILFCVLLYSREKKARLMLARCGSVILPLVIAFILAQASLNNALQLQEEQNVYSTITQRLGNINISVESSGNRIIMWKWALDYAQKNPWMGCGYGNWKLASLIYENKFTGTAENYIALHCHNDFLELAADIGIPGALLYFSLFICVAIYTCKKWLLKTSPEILLTSVVASMALSAYFIDACFNFPMERPVMQLFFAFALATSLVSFINPIAKNNIGKPVRFIAQSVFATIAALFLLPAAYITYMTYHSSVVQKRVNADGDLAVPKLGWDEIKKLPDIPNINIVGYPIGAIKARYLLLENKSRPDTNIKKQAFDLLDKTAKDNPLLMYNEFVKAGYYIDTDKMDSAFYYSSKVFFNKPKTHRYFRTLAFTCFRLKDTLTLERAFKEHRYYVNHDSLAWNQYLGYMSSLSQNKQKLVLLADTALALFPNYPELKQTIAVIKNAEIQYTGNTTSDPMAMFVMYFNAGMKAYGENKFSLAATYFTNATKINPNDYICIENTGMSYYSLQDYNRAIVYYDKVIAAKAIRNGKSEFYKGVCLINLGRKQEGCRYLHMAEGLNNKDARRIINQYCK